MSIKIIVVVIVVIELRGQQPCKFIGKKESAYKRKELNSHRIGLVLQNDHRFIVSGRQHMIWLP